MESTSKPTTESTIARTKSASDTPPKSLTTGFSTVSKAMKAAGSNTIRIAFLVKGNGIEAAGNPMSKIRLTKAQQWMPKAQRYATWKAHVLNTALAAMRGAPEYPMMIRNLGTLGKPFSTKKHIRGHMSVRIRFSDDTHGDPEGVFGSIADALFKQDKYLDGAFEGEMVRGCGEVDVVITLKEI